ncbi:MAG: hypothetical protein IKT12_06340, partial [Thermoguttaceae bacterium]|nr:hypothetical protein [Thermoguttaceae bacterium]
MEEFLSGYYAPELTPLYMRYFDLLCDASEKSGKPLPIFQGDTSDWLDLDTFNACAEILDRVDAKAAELETADPERNAGLLNKVRRERLSFDMALLLAYNRFAEQAQNEGKEFRAPARGEMPAFCDGFRARCKAVGLNRYSEGGGPDRFEQYLTDIFEKIAGTAAE